LGRGVISGTPLALQVLKPFMGQCLRSCVLFHIILCPLIASAQSQKGDHEISVSYGIGSFTEMLVNLTSDDQISYQTHNAQGIFAASYRYYITDNIALGIAAAQQSFSYASSSDGYNNYNADYKVRITTVAVEFKGIYPVLEPGGRRHRRWCNLPYFQYYGLVSIGLRKFDQSPATPSYSHLQMQGLSLNSQWSPICFRVGGALAGFAELGIGYKGFLSGGLSYRLGKREGKRGLNY
jgi:hypothetical protein